MKEKIYQWIRKHKEIVVLLMLLAGILCFFLVNDFQSKDDYYDVTLKTVQETENTESQSTTSEEIQTDNSVEKTSESDDETSGDELTETIESNTTSETQSETLEDKTESLETNQVETEETTQNIQTPSSVDNQNIQTTENITTTKKDEPKETTVKTITVYISIECKNILNNLDSVTNYAAMKSIIPKDGIIWKKTAYQIDAGSTVFDLLEMVTKANKIQLDYNGKTKNIYGTIYVKGISNIYEKCCGNSSGWMYTLNEEWIGTGCDSKKLKDGDYVQWRFTCDGGDDLKID